MLLFSFLFCVPLIVGTEDQIPNPYSLEIEKGILKEIICGDSLVEILDLSSMEIESIHKKAFENLKHLKSLDLRNNSLEILSEFIFANLSTLEHISLAENNISALQLKNVFVGLDNLRTLNVSFNHKLYLNEGIFFGLPKGVKIYVHGNKFSSISPMNFEKKRSAEILKQNRLDLKRMEAEKRGPYPPNFNASEFIPRRTSTKLCTKKGTVSKLEILKSTEKIEEHCSAIHIDYLLPQYRQIGLAKLQIEDFDEGWYRLPKLLINSINLWGNKIQTISKNLLNDLPNNIIGINLDNNIIKKLTSKVIKNKVIKYLTLKANLIEEIENGTFNYTSLAILDLSVNKLKNLTFVKSLPSTISRLDLSENQIQFIPVDVFTNLSNLTHLTLEANNISKLESDSFRGLESIKVLSLSENRLLHIPSDSFKNLSNLRDLDLRENSISILENGVFDNIKKLSILDLSGNKLIKITKDMFSQLPKSLEVLRISNNKIEMIESGSFIKVPKVSLALDGNKISDILPGTFDLSEMIQLRLNNNSLSVVKFKYFEGLPKIKSLWLQDNQIMKIEKGAFRKRPFLADLDISNNPLQSLQSGIFYGLPTNATVKIFNNSIEMIQSDLFDNFNP